MLTVEFIPDGHLILPSQHTQACCSFLMGFILQIRPKECSINVIQSSSLLVCQKSRL